ncbi:MAG: radical SAM protein [Candidatus Lokiarchaeota archaeon]|nr:radical SAM protein [Candidatus Lokiarchaeota archaeon]
MAGISFEKIRQDPGSIMALNARQLASLKKQAFKDRIDRFGYVLHCHAPGFDGIPYETESFAPGRGAFESVSITGGACALQCDHCKGHLLQTMRHADAGNFEQVLQAMIEGGVRGILVSGGSDKEGKVPILTHVGALKRAKSRHDIDILIHSGFMDDAELQALQGSGIDGIMFDFPGSSETIKSVCHLDKTPADFARMVATCKRIDVPVMPHVIIGLDWGQVKGEIDALAMLGQLQPDVLVLVVLMPIPGTPMADLVLDITNVEKVILAARILNPGIPIQLGCAKPQGEFKERSERFAVECGLNGIAYPLEETIGTARELGLDPVFHDDCCALVSKHARPG